MEKDVSFVVGNSKCELKPAKDFLVKEVNVLKGDGEEKAGAIRLLYFKPTKAYSILMLVCGELESVKVSMVLKACTYHGFQTSQGSVELKGVYLGKEGRKEDVLDLDRMYIRLFRSHEMENVEEGFDIVFFMATLSSTCSGRTSVVFEVGGKDVTVCTLSYGCCSNAFFGYKYRRGETLPVHVIGQGDVSLIGNVVGKDAFR